MIDFFLQKLFNSLFQHFFGSTQKPSTAIPPLFLCIEVLYHLFVKQANMAMYRYQNVQCVLLKQNQNILDVIYVTLYYLSVCLMKGQIEARILNRNDVILLLRHTYFKINFVF